MFPLSIYFVYMIWVWARSQDFQKMLKFVVNKVKKFMFFFIKEVATDSRLSIAKVRKTMSNVIGKTDDLR